MELDAEALAKQMLGAALPILRKEAVDSQSFAEVEFTKIAQTIVSIQKMLAEGQINQQQATLLLDMQKSARGAFSSSYGREIHDDLVVANRTSCEAKQSKLGKGDLAN